MKMIINSNPSSTLKRPRVVHHYPQQLSCSTYDDSLERLYLDFPQITEDQTHKDARKGHYVSTEDYMTTIQKYSRLQYFGAIQDW
jgi:hypothetical protein